MRLRVTGQLLAVLVATVGALAAGRWMANEQADRLLPTAAHQALPTRPTGMSAERWDSLGPRVAWRVRDVSDLVAKRMRVVPLTMNDIVVETARKSLGLGDARADALARNLTDSVLAHLAEGRAAVRQRLGADLAREPAERGASLHLACRLVSTLLETLPLLSMDETRAVVHRVIRARTIDQFPGTADQQLRQANQLAATGVAVAFQLPRTRTCRDWLLTEAPAPALAAFLIDPVVAPPPADSIRWSDLGMPADPTGGEALLPGGVGDPRSGRTPHGHAGARR